MPVLQLHSSENSEKKNYTLVRKANVHEVDVASQQNTLVTTRKADQRMVVPSLFAVASTIFVVEIVMNFAFAPLLRWLTQTSPTISVGRWADGLAQIASFFLVVVMGIVIGRFSNRRAIVPGILVGSIVSRAAWLAILSPVFHAASSGMPPPLFWLRVLLFAILEIVTEIGIALYVSRRKIPVNLVSNIFRREEKLSPRE